MMKPYAQLRIRHLLIDESVHSQANGVHHVARRMVREQVRQGQDARILLLHAADQTPKLDGWDVPPDMLPLEGLQLFGHFVLVGARIIGALAKDADENTVVHIHGGRRPMLYYIARELARRHIPYVITIHGRYSHLQESDLASMRSASALYLSLIERGVLEKALFVHALTEQEAVIIGRIAPGARIEILANAAYSSVFDPKPERPDRASPSSCYPTFGFCGRYAVRHKGLDLLLEGFSQYCDAGGTGRLVLAGTGDREPLLDLVARFGLEGRATIGSGVFGDEKNQAMQSWDFFIQASRFDGHPIGALEGALAGLPLIVSEATGLQGPVKQYAAGFVIENLSATTVAAALHQASQVGPDGWVQMSRNVHTMVLDVGDWTAIALRLQDFYTCAVEEKQPA